MHNNYTEFLKKYRFKFKNTKFESYDYPCYSIFRNKNNKLNFIDNDVIEKNKLILF